MNTHSLVEIEERKTQGLAPAELLTKLIAQIKDPKMNTGRTP